MVIKTIVRRDKLCAWYQRDLVYSV